MYSVCAVSEWYAAFQVFDKNNDGHISSSELLHIMRKMQQDPTDQEITDMILELDENS